MIAKHLFRPIVGDELLTRGLADPEARILVEWLVLQAERAAIHYSCEERTGLAITAMCRRARALSRFVSLWGDPRNRGAAYQLAATERFDWPLPIDNVDPCDLMIDILEHEAPQFA